VIDGVWSSLGCFVDIGRIGYDRVAASRDEPSPHRASKTEPAQTTHSQVLQIAALKLPNHVGAFPIFLSGVNSPVVILRSTPAFGSV
jgi:hypothetical protein